MAGGIGAEGAYGAAGTYQGLQDWMRGRRQQVVQGQQDADRLRTQGMQDQELEVARQELLRQHGRQDTADQRTATEFGWEQDDRAKQAAAAASAKGEMQGLIDMVKASDWPAMAKIGAEISIRQGKGLPQEAYADLKKKEYKPTIAPDGTVIDLADRANLGTRHSAPRVEPQGPRPEHQWVLRGPNKEMVYTNQVQPGDLPAPRTGTQATAAKVATPAQKKVLSFFNRMRDATSNLEGLEKDIAGQGLAGSLQGQYAPNLLQTDSQRAYRQSQRAFTEARLRKDSGAAVPQPEYDNDAVTYFVQPGDDDVTVTNKRKGRQTILDSLQYEAGPAFGEFYGDEGGAAPKTVTRAQLDALARKRGTDVQTQAARAAANGYTVVD